MGRKSFVIHDFYCLNCGQTMPLARKKSLIHKDSHRKRLYCPFCKEEVNMVECRTPDEVDWFKQEFQAGHFKEEAIASMEHIREENDIYG